MLNTPENLARRDIDTLLEQAGWILQNPDEQHLGAGKGIAVREFHLDSGFADYLLYVNRQMVGVVEAKKQGMPLTGVEWQAEKYSTGVPERFPAARVPLPFIYISTGKETKFANQLDPAPRSRNLFAFHTPETLEAWLADGENTLRRRTRTYPPLIERGLWQAQITAIKRLEESIADDRPRALIQMATGAGKTFAAVNFIYRMLQHGKFQRVLFLVDRTNLGKQALQEFQNFATPDDGRKFTEIYNVQRLASNRLDPVSRVTITTIQRLYSMLKGEEDLDPAVEEVSLWEDEAATKGDPRVVTYNPRIPIEYFDAIVVDECHRSIYNVWRQVLEYFDAYIIGLTATPSKQTFGFFNQNLVMEYTRADAIVDGVNVDSRLYVIRTRISGQGSRIEADGETYLPKRDKRTREVRMELLDQDFEYNAEELDRKVTTPDQIRTIIRTFRDKVIPEAFPDRDHVPKTLIFAKDDSHAEEIVGIVREEFAQGNEFCRKITYKVTGVNPEQLIAEFRNSFNPRIAVSVDMIATGTDIKPLEVLLFMRPVKSPQLYEQMQGRGVRVIDTTDLRVVSPDAGDKEFFLLVDAVGVTELPKAETPTLERLPSVSLTRLLDDIARGSADDDIFTTLAGRLARMQRRLRPDDRDAIERASGGLSLSEIARALHDATSLDAQIDAAQRATGQDEPTTEQIQAAERQLKFDAADLLTPTLRKVLIEIHTRDEIVIDELSQDEVLQAEFVVLSDDEAAQMVQTFSEFIEEHRDEIKALEILYNLPYNQQRLTWAHIKELSQRLEAPPHHLSPDKLWAAYAKVDPARVRMSETKRILTDLVALVRHALEPDSDLIPFPEQVRERYAAWLAEQEATGRRFTGPQRAWLDAIAEHIGMNLALDLRAFNDAFYDLGGIQAALSAFGGPDSLRELVDELNDRLAA